MALDSKVRVPQKDGQISIAVGGDEPRTWNVSDHLVSPQSYAEQDLLLSRVDGARLASEKELDAAASSSSTAAGGKTASSSAKEK